MKRIFTIVVLCLLVVTTLVMAEGNTILLPAKNQRLAEIIVIEDGSPRRTESGRLMIDGDASSAIISTERYKKNAVLVTLDTMTNILAEIKCYVVDEEFDEAKDYLKACFRYFDAAGHYMPKLDGKTLEEAKAAGAKYVSLARFHSSIVAKKAADVEFNGGVTISVGYTITIETVITTDGKPLQVEKKHYAIMPEEKSKKHSSSNPPAKTQNPGVTTTPGPDATATPGPDSTPTATPTTSTNNTPNPQFSDIVYPPFDDDTTVVSNTPAPSFSSVSLPKFDGDTASSSNSSENPNPSFSSVTD